jgi:hypothetical protein
MFFFEKKNQKTFLHCTVFNQFITVQMNESLFASFSTEKEESSFHPSVPARLPLRSAGNSGSPRP